MDGLKHALRAAYVIYLLGAIPAPARAQPPDERAAPPIPRSTADVILTPVRGETPRGLAGTATVLDQATLATLPVVHLPDVDG